MKKRVDTTKQRHDSHHVIIVIMTRFSVQEGEARTIYPSTNSIDGVALCEGSKGQGLKKSPGMSNHGIFNFYESRGFYQVIFVRGG